jgi:hypothetical protein
MSLLLTNIMNIIPDILIPLFYWKDDIDSFLAAGAAKKFFLEKNPAETIALSEGDYISGLGGKFPIFFGVQFNRLQEMPDLSAAMNCVFMSRYDQLDTLLKDLGPDEVDFSKLPSQDGLPEKAKAFGKKSVRWRMHFNDYEALIRMAFVALSSKQRANEIMPDSLKYIAAAIENKKTDPASEHFVQGLSRDQSLLADDYPSFDERIIMPFQFRKQDIVDTVTAIGRRKMEEEDRLIKVLIERNAIISEFAGHKVKIAHLPSEMASRAGYQMAANMPFAVVFEDIMSENKRIYHLYSVRGGMNVFEIGKPYKAVGNARYATFHVKVDFSNHKFL